MLHFSEKQVREAVESSRSVRQTMIKLNMNENSNYHTIYRLVKLYNLDISHFTGQAHLKGVTSDRKKDISYYLCNNSSKRISTHKLKLKLIEENIKSHQCEKCLKTEWNGRLIPIELHHIDGNKFNNELSNLQVLCPNCHAQTPNHAGRGKKKKYATVYVKLNKPKKEITKKIYQCIYCEAILKTKSEKCYNCSHLLSRKVEHPSKETLEEELKNNSYLALSRKYGVSDNAIRKWAIRYGISENIIRKQNRATSEN